MVLDTMIAEMNYDSFRREENGDISKFCLRGYIYQPESKRCLSLPDPNLIIEAKNPFSDIYTPEVGESNE